MDTAALIKEFEAYCSDNALKPMSADELECWCQWRVEAMKADAQAILDAATVMHDHARWMRTFCKRWDAAQSAEDDSAFAFFAWHSTRVWCADFDVAGYPHVIDHLSDSEAADGLQGYGYADGAWIRDNGPNARSGHRYWTMAGRGDVASDDLAAVERFLWDEHSKYEFDAQRRAANVSGREGLTMTTTMTKTEYLASLFADLLKARLEDDEWDEMRRRNVTYGDACASHDFCDANDLISEAFEEVFGHEPDGNVEADAALWNAAWDIAKRLYLTRL